MPRKISKVQDLTLWHGGDDLPPATAAKQAKPKKVLNLADTFSRVYSERPRRIA